MKEVEKAQEAIEREEYDVAMRLLRGSADSGSAEAQYLLGYLYFTSADVTRDWGQVCNLRFFTGSQIHLNCKLHA